jgi:hypothetical protein
LLGQLTTETWLRPAIGRSEQVIVRRHIRARS